MISLTDKISKALAERNGWSPDFAEGVLQGEYSRRASARIPMYCAIGIDDYCLGFRAGYFERHSPTTDTLQRDRVAAPNGWPAGLAPANLGKARSGEEKYSITVAASAAVVLLLFASRASDFFTAVQCSHDRY
jgi:hypothetical protein